MGHSSKQTQKPAVVTFTNLYKTMQPGASNEPKDGKEKTPIAKKKPRRPGSKGPGSKLGQEAYSNVGGTLATQSAHGSMKKLDKIKPPLLK